MIFQRPRKFTLAQIALMPVLLPVLLVGLAPFAVVAAYRMARGALLDRA